MKFTRWSATVGTTLLLSHAATAASPLPAKFPKELHVWLEANIEHSFFALQFDDADFVLECDNGRESGCQASRALRATAKGLVPAPELLRGLTSNGKKVWRLLSTFGRFPSAAWAVAKTADDEQTAILDYRNDAWEVTRGFDASANVTLLPWAGSPVAQVTLANRSQFFVALDPSSSLRFPVAEKPAEAASAPLAYDKPQFIGHVLADGTLAALYHYDEWPGVGLWAFHAGDAKPRTTLYPDILFHRELHQGRVTWKEPDSVIIEAWGNLPNGKKAATPAALRVTASLRAGGWAVTSERFMAVAENRAFDALLASGSDANWEAALGSADCSLAFPSLSIRKSFAASVSCPLAERSFFVSLKPLRLGAAPP